MRRWFLFCYFIVILTSAYSQKTPTRPNILICISDDQSFPHTSAYGTDWVNTPGFDRVAREGILFMNAYTPNAKCSPSRSCIITGRNSWQLEEAANHVPFFPEKYVTYAEALKEAGYRTGYTGKGWAPGDPGTMNGQRRELLGSNYSALKTTPPAKYISGTDYSANFEAFLEGNNGDEPFCFWYGGHEPHRRYEYGAGINKAGKKLTDIDDVFEFWPDNDTVRTDILDYAFEIEYFDQHLVRILEILEDQGQLENTIVVVTSDNGMPFPRVKGQSYEHSNHLPLAIMWKNGISDPGRSYDPFVSFTDFAPTFLDAAGVNGEHYGMQPMEGNSLVPVFQNRSDPNQRDFMVIGKERHDLGRPEDTGYPIRGIVQDSHLYLINYKPNRWPAGNPETGYMNTDGSPTKTMILNERRLKDQSLYWQWNFGKRDGEELYDLARDPDCVHDLSGQDSYQPLKEKLKSLLLRELREEGDPRVFGNGDIFEEYNYSEERNRHFYERFIRGDDIKAGWINPSDIEKQSINERP
ncbi:sulfatase [Membranicola marinus]|uniref:Sulfatase n=1 Tax=Membranihabitans marinus TaxID=1227546 RepID=A0A953HY97_9BACT|nr:sulfatase [Membranihabitans marinus]MBY5958876.1 sulfatase [Membranihabitans marinus]